MGYGKIINRAKNPVFYDFPLKKILFNSKSKDNTNAKDKAKSKEKQVGNSGGGSSKISKNSNIKVVKPNSKTNSKRQISSKAYDLINRGYIKETKPW